MGKFLSHHKILDSTQNNLWNLVAEQYLAEGYVVVADQQTAGRGQRGAHWVDAAGKSLCFSVFLRPHAFDAARHFELTQAFSIGLTTALHHWVPELKIKWPNDLYVSNKKMGGMLIETRLQGGYINELVLGVGINIAPSDITNLPQATSLSAQESVANRALPSIYTVLEACLVGLEQAYLQLLAGKTAHIAAQYHQQLFRLGVWAKYCLPDGSVFEGQIKNVGPDGGLRIKLLNGEEQVFGNKEVSFLF